MSNGEWPAEFGSGIVNRVSRLLRQFSTEVREKRLEGIFPD